MTLSLKTKFILIFVFLGIFMAAISSAVFYFSFNNLLRDEMESDLTNEAEEFAEHVVIRDGKMITDEMKEWEELEHIRDSEYSRYVIITDTNFNTIRKSLNLGQHDFQSYYDFKPTTVVKSYDIENGFGTIFLCGVPFLIQQRRVGYVLAAENFKRTDQFIGLFNGLSFFLFLS